MRLPKYPECRDSGIRWLGLIPSHWRVRKLKHFCLVFPSNVDKHSREGERAIRLCNYTDVYYNDQITAAMSFMEATATDDQIAKFSLRAGDTIITKDSESADDIAVSAYVPEDLPGVICGYHLSMVRPNGETSGSFVKRLFDSTYAKSRFAVSANGLTRVGLGQYALDNVEFPLPPMAEQSAIAAFLDRETAKIGALIAEQERLLELLAEKRQAVISHAVTKGLNPEAPMKDSGVAWLGRVPAHWSVARVKTVCEFTTSGPRGWSERLTENGDLFIQSGDLNDFLGIEFETANRVAVGDDAESARTRLSEGDVVVCITGAKTGKVAVCCGLNEPAYVNQHLCLMRPNGLVDGRFMAFALAGTAGQLQLEASQYGLKQGLSLEDVREVWIAFPKVEEQKAILSWLVRQTEEFSALVEEAIRAVSLLRERRAAIIAAAITGQIDVREAA